VDWKVEPVHSGAISHQQSRKMGVPSHAKINFAVQKTAKIIVFGCNQLVVAKWRSSKEKKHGWSLVEISWEVEQLKYNVSTRDMNLFCKTDGNIARNKTAQELANISQERDVWRNVEPNQSRSSYPLMQLGWKRIG
jgi:hypothetical protein